VDLCVNPLTVARQRLGKHVPAAIRNCCRRRFYASHVISKESRRSFS
jgi:hypothetical protein